MEARLTSDLHKTSPGVAGDAVITDPQIGARNFWRDWYFLVPGLVLYFHALALDNAYRTLLYLNIGLAVAYMWRYPVHFSSGGRQALIWLMTFALSLIVLHLLSPAAGAKEVRHIVAYACLALGATIIQLQLRSDSQDRRHYLFAVFFVLSYTIVQSVATFGAGMPFGTTKNPHYLAQYSLLLLFTAGYLALNAGRKFKLALVIAMALLATLLIHTSSRPAWLAFIVGALMFFTLLRREIGWKPIMVAIVGLAMTYFFNGGGVSDRINDLIANVGTEERVTIWQDAWQALSAGGPRQWLLGHGIDSFEAGFVAFSRYHERGINFHAPHNHIIELVYSIGLIGLSIALVTFFALYRRLVVWRRQPAGGTYVATLMTLLTVNLIFTSVAMSFFSSYNMVIFSVVGGSAMASLVLNERGVRCG